MATSGEENDLAQAPDVASIRNVSRFPAVRLLAGPSAGEAGRADALGDVRGEIWETVLPGQWSSRSSNTNDGGFAATQAKIGGQMNAMLSCACHNMRIILKNIRIFCADFWR